MSSRLFDPAHIKQMVLRNRFVRSATYDRSADRGFVTETQVKLAADLAAGGVGLIITGMTYTHPSGQMNPVQSSLAGDEFIPGCKKLVDAVHERGAKVAVQLPPNGAVQVSLGGGSVAGGCLSAGGVAAGGVWAVCGAGLSWALAVLAPTTRHIAPPTSALRTSLLIFDSPDAGRMNAFIP